MDSSMLDLTNNLNQSIERGTSLTIEREQNRFFETTLGRIINKGIDIGIRAALPDFLEDSVIEVKDSLMRDGLGPGIQTAIDQTLEIGRRALGLLREGFGSVSEARDIFNRGRLTENVSKEIDDVLTRVGTSSMLNDELKRGIMVRKRKNIRKC